MKPKTNRRDLLSKDDIWNAVVEVISNYDLSSDDQKARDAFLLFQYYSELESGGHEMLFTWFSEYIDEVGITTYLKELIDILEKIEANSYASIMEEHGHEIWNLLKKLENGRIDEEEYYQVIAVADRKYDHLKGKLGELLEAYFVNIHQELIEVID